MTVTLWIIIGLQSKFGFGSLLGPVFIRENTEILLPPNFTVKNFYLTPGLKEAEDCWTKEHDLVIRMSCDQEHSTRPTEISVPWFGVELRYHNVKCKTREQNGDQHEGQLLHCQFDNFLIFKYIRYVTAHCCIASFIYINQ